MNRIVREDMEWLLNSGLSFNQLEGKNLFVAGASSFLASYMIEAVLFYNDNIAAKPCVITGLVRDIEKANNRFLDYSGRPDLIIIKGDICDLKDVENKQDYIIHAASQASPKYYGIDPVGTMLPNINGTYNLLEMSKRHGSQGFLFLSSSEVYGGPQEGVELFSENSFGYLDSMNVRSCYAEGKRAGETLCKIYAEKEKMNVKVVRPFHTYGPHMALDGGRVYEDFVKNAVHHENIVLKSDGSAIRAFCYSRDAVYGFFKVLFDGKSGEAYNIASDKDVLSIRELAELIVNIFPERKMSLVFDAAKDSGNYIKSSVSVCRPDITKARLLGFDPMIRIKDGFKRTIESYI